MEGNCSTGQSPQRAVAPTKEEEEEEEEATTNVFWIIRAADRGKLDVLMPDTVHITYEEVNVEFQALLIFAPASPSGQNN